MEVEIDGDMYHIMRGRKHPLLKNRVEVRRGTHDLTLGTDRLTQARISNLLGCSPEVFNAAVYMGQENMPDLPNMTDKALKAVLEEALSLDRLDAALDVTNKQIEELVAEAKSLQTSIHNVEVEIRAIDTNATWLTDSIGALYSDLDALGEQESAYNKHRDMARDAWDAVRATLDQELAERKETVEPTQRNDLQDKRRAIEGDLSKVVTHLTREQYALCEVERHIAAVRDGDDVCGHCLQPMPVVDTAEELSALQVKVTRHTDKIKQLKAYKIKLTNDKTAIEDAIEALITKMASVRTKDQIRSELDREMVRWDQAQAAYKIAMGRLQRQAAEKTLAIKEKEEASTRAETKLVTLRADHKVYDLRLTECQAQLEVLSKVKYALGRKGFRGEVLDHVTPYLNARTDHYLAALTDGNISATWNTLNENADGDYVENFHIKVCHESGVDKFAMLSGGEKRKVRLACALALQDLVATRAVKPIKLFIADEIDDAIDTAGLELLMGVLEDKATTMGSVFIISHNDLSAWARNHITVTKHGGLSTFKAH